MGQHRLLPPVADDASVRVEPEALKLPDALIPEIEAGVIPGHLRFDEADVLVGGGLRHRMQLGKLAFHAVEQAQLETDQVVVDAHPMTRVFPVLGLDVLTLERAGRRRGAGGSHGNDYTEAVARLCQLLLLQLLPSPKETRRTWDRRRNGFQS